MKPTDVDQLHFRATIIGAGQAGLSAAHELRRRGVDAKDITIIDSNEGPGGAWRHRWDSLTLGKAHGIADLPGLPMKRPDPEIPASTLVTEYYGAYEEEFDFDVVRPAPVRRVESADPDNDALRVHIEGGVSFTTELLLNATGTWDNAYIPYIKGIETFQGKQLHTKDFARKEDFAGKRTLVVGGGLSAVQFLLDLADVTDTIWATRRPPNFTKREFDDGWGLAVERAVRERTHSGQAPASVVRTTGIPQWPAYLDGVADGTLVARGMFNEITPAGVVFGKPDSMRAEGLGPSASTDLQVPDSWDPLPEGAVEDVDIIFWNTGFRPALRHLAPMKLRERDGGILMQDEVTPARDSRIFLVGYGSNASTVGATRAGRLAGRRAAKQLATS